MNTRDFARSLRATGEVFTQLGLVEVVLGTVSIEPSEEFRRIAYSDDSRYVDLYRAGLTNDDYSILLRDLSYLQFYHWEGRGSFGLRYAYYPNPFDFLPYSEFLTRFGMEDMGSDAYEMYLDLLTSETESSRIPPIRYDLAFRDYCELEHPTSHLHFGMHEENRWPLDRILTPRAFGLIVAKMFYSSVWLARGGGRGEHPGGEKPLERMLGDEKAACGSLEGGYFSDLERRQFYLG